MSKARKILQAAAWVVPSVTVVLLLVRCLQPGSYFLDVEDFAQFFLAASTFPACGILHLVGLALAPLVDVGSLLESLGTLGWIAIILFQWLVVLPWVMGRLHNKLGVDADTPRARKSAAYVVPLVAYGVAVALFMDALTYTLSPADPVTGAGGGCYTLIERLLGTKSNRLTVNIRVVEHVIALILVAAGLYVSARLRRPQSASV